MARRPRIIDGVELVANLYADARKRTGYFRYRRPDGTFRVFRAASVKEANQIASEANQQRSTYQPPRRKPAPSASGAAIEAFISWREAQHPSLTSKESWEQRRYALRKFAREFPNVSLLSYSDIAKWWDSLSHHQQVLRQAEFRKLFVYLMQEGYSSLPYNPFTTSWDQPRLMIREKGAKQRSRLTLHDFWKIHDRAPEALKTAMELSLVTTMRRSDIVSLRFDEHVQGRFLRKVISKSKERLGEIWAARLEWNLDENPALDATIKRARGFATTNGKCPFLISQMPDQRRLGKYKVHVAQVLPDLLTKMFREACSQARVGGDRPPSFHEVRSLGSALYARQGESLTDVQQLMAHKKPDMTRAYMSGHELPWTQVEIGLAEIPRQ